MLDYEFVTILYSCYAILFHVLLRICLLFFVLSRGSIGNSLATSSEVVVWTVYILPSPDLTMWEYTGFVVVVVVVVECNLK